MPPAKRIKKYRKKVVKKWKKKKESVKYAQKP